MSDLYITSNEGLRKIIDLAYKKKTIAVDTEFTREKTYYPILSLVQIAVDDKTFVVDCLHDIDLKPIFDIVADAEVKKILHSCAQDLQIFFQKSKRMPQNVVDVQVMANFCGIGYNIGYSNLTERLLGIEVDKQMQRSDWQQRPLNAKQIEYAKKDVLYLEEIYQQLCDILADRKRTKWFEEEMTFAIGKAAAKTDEALFKNFSVQRKFISKTPAQMAKLQSLILWREKNAQLVDLPRQHFLEDRLIEEMVMMENFDLELEEFMIDEARRIMADHNEIEYEDCFEERRIAMTELQKSQLQKAKNLIAKIAKDEDLKEQFLITTPMLKNIILGQKKVDEIISGWRYYLFGQKLEKLIAS